jgi:secondary thiamine-phosphate synthase enzyme
VSILAFYAKTIKLRTTSRLEVINITDHVEKAVEESGVKNGLCLVHVPHATAALVLNEDEPNLKQDLLRLVDELTRNNWMHNRIDNNAEAHLASILLGSTRILPVINGKLVRGTWQEIMLVELDGPRSERRVVISLIGE